MKTLLATIFLFFASMVYAEPYKESDGYASFHSEIVDDKTILHIRGIMGPRFTHSALKAFFHVEPDLVIIDSTGGIVNEMMPIANYIERNSIPIKVVHSCLSACAYMLLFSPNVIIEEGSQVGFHVPFAPLVSSNKTMEQLQREYAVVQIRLAARLLEIDIPLSFTQYLLARTDRSNFAFLTTSDGLDLIRSGNYSSLRIDNYIR